MENKIKVIRSINDYVSSDITDNQFKNSVIVYCRVSTVSQIDGSSLDTQQQNGIEYFEKHFNKLCCQIKNDFPKKRLSDINLLKNISFARIHFRVFRKVKPIIFLYLRYLFNYHILSRKNFVKKEK